MKPTVFLDPHLIRTYRNSLGLSQGRLADRLLPLRTSSTKASLTRTIQQWEKDGRVSKKWAICLARVLKVELVNLMDIEVEVSTAVRVNAAPVIVGPEEREQLGFLIRVSEMLGSEAKAFVGLVIHPNSRHIVGTILHRRQHCEVTDQEVVIAVRRAQDMPSLLTSDLCPSSQRVAVPPDRGRFLGVFD